MARSTKTGSKDKTVVATPVGGDLEFHKDFDDSVAKNVVASTKKNFDKNRKWVPTQEDYQLIYNEVFQGTTIQGIAAMLGIHPEIFIRSRQSTDSRLMTESGVNAIELVYMTAMTHRHRPIRRKLYQKAFDDDDINQFKAMELVLSEDPTHRPVKGDGGVGSGSNANVQINVAQHPAEMSADDQERLINIVKND